MLVSNKGTPTWQFHAGLYKFMQNIASNNLKCRITHRLKTWRSVFFIWTSYNIPVLSFNHWMVFELLFLCVTVQAKNSKEIRKLTFRALALCWSESESKVHISFMSCHYDSSTYISNKIVVVVIISCCGHESGCHITAFVLVLQAARISWQRSGFWLVNCKCLKVIMIMRLFLFTFC